MNIPFFKLDLPQHHLDSVTSAMRSGWLTRGPLCSKFEDHFAEYVGAKYAVSTNSSSMALFASLLASGVKSNDLVIIPALTFTAVAEAVLLCGAQPILVDSDPETLQMSKAAVEDAMDWAAATRGSQRVAAILPVHYGGLVDSDYVSPREWISEDISIVNDASHCLPSYFIEKTTGQRKPIGKLEGMSCYSFYANKCITTCEGGMITTNDFALANVVRSITNHGVTFPENNGAIQSGRHEYDVRYFGLKGTMPDPLAALGLAQLRDADSYLLRREHIARRYNGRFKGKLAARLPAESGFELSSWHLYAIRLLESRELNHRDRVMRTLAEKGIHTSYHWKPLHLHTSYQRLEKENRIHVRPTKNIERVWKSLISLPIYPSLTDLEIDYICDTVLDAVGEIGRDQ